jgi:hypothetical protein
MKRIFQKAGSLVMALLVLFSTMSFSVNKHFCGNELVDFAIFSKAITCTSEAKTCGAKMDHEMDHEMVTDEKDSCCTNQKTELNGQDELSISFHFLDLNQQLFLTAFTYSFIYKYEGYTLTEIPFRYYTPPLLVTDIQVLDQVFLI